MMVSSGQKNIIRTKSDQNLEGGNEQHCKKNHTTQAINNTISTLRKQKLHPAALLVAKHDDHAKRNRSIANGKREEQRGT